MVLNIFEWRKSHLLYNQYDVSISIAQSSMRECMPRNFSRIGLIATSWTVAHQAHLSIDFPGKSTPVGCHFPLQAIFPTQGSNLCLLNLLHWQILYHWVPWEANSRFDFSPKLLSRKYDLCSCPVVGSLKPKAVTCPGIMQPLTMVRRDRPFNPLLQDMPYYTSGFRNSATSHTEPRLTSLRPSQEGTWTESDS